MSEIKIENAQPSGNPGLGNPQAAAIAVQRAANLMQQKFGSQANNSIGAMQSSGLARQQSQAQASSSAQSSEQQHKNGAGPPQTDGPSSPVAETWTLVMRTRAANGADETVRVEADATIRQHVLAMGQEIEGGGLMLPLRERVKPVKSAIANRKKRKLATAAQSGPVENTFNAAAMPQLDGGLDSDSDAEDVIKDEAAPGLFDEEVDEDAINSDLDDPEENVESAEDDDEVIGPIMLCMYDKVQRVKNKWKCTLKDGVLTINRRE
jgi:transcription initiation factor TFIIA large subunit